MPALFPCVRPKSLVTFTPLILVNEVCSRAAMKSSALALAVCNAIVAACAVETNTTAAPTAAPTPACTPGNWRTSYTNEHFELRWHCEACRPGTYSSTYNALKCVECDDGKYSIGGLAGCSDCPLGRYVSGRALPSGSRRASPSPPRRRPRTRPPRLPSARPRRPRRLPPR